MKINKDKAKDYLWGTAEWTKRTQFIAKLIPSQARVIDLGGGLGHLYKYLDNCDYLSLDIDTFTDLTVKADFNKGNYPDLKPPFQYIVAQGIIEYMVKPRDFLKQIKKYGDILIITYRRWTPDKWRAPRKEFSFDDINTFLQEAKWERVMEKNLLADKSGPIEKVIICRKKS